MMAGAVTGLAFGIFIGFVMVFSIRFHNRGRKKTKYGFTLLDNTGLSADKNILLRNREDISAEEYR